MGSMSNYKGDSKSLALLENQPFTIISVEKSTFTTKDGVVKPSVNIEIDSAYTIEDQDVTNFHTTRAIIVKTLTKENIMADINGGDPLGPVYCKKIVKEKNKGNSYFILEDYEDPDKPKAVEAQ